MYLSELFRRGFRRVENGLPAQYEVLERLRERVQTEGVADRAVKRDALIWSETTDVAGGNVRFESAGSGLYDVVHLSPPSEKRGESVAIAKNAIVPMRAKVVMSCLRRSPRSLAAPCRAPILSTETLRGLKRKRKNPDFVLSSRVRGELQRSLAAIYDLEIGPGFVARDARRVRHLEERTWQAFDLFTLAESLARDEEIRVSVAQARSVLLRLLLDQGVEDRL